MDAQPTIIFHSALLGHVNPNERGALYKKFWSLGPKYYSFIEDDADAKGFFYELDVDATIADFLPKGKELLRKPLECLMPMEDGPKNPRHKGFRFCLYKVNT